jgi:surface polysaccharide O-acyltransferase-like enzyme
MSMPLLGSYRISQPLSAKLRLVTFLAVTAVVFVHAYNLSNRFAVGENTTGLSAAPGVAGFVEYLVSQALMRWPAAMLFAISGFLFFHNLQPRWRDYRRKYAGRVRTVVAPFLLWSAIGLTIYLALQALPWSSPYFRLDFYGDGSAAFVVDKLLLHPVAYPLWFLQTLIVCFALAPLLYWPARAVRWLVVLPFAALWIIGAPAANWNDWKGVTFFTLGTVIALERRRGVRLTPAPWVGRLALPVWVASCVLYTALLRDVSTFWAYGLHKGLMCMAVAAIWFGYDAYVRPLERRRVVCVLLPFSFFIFVAQEPLLTMFKRLGLELLGASDAALLVVYFGAAMLTLAVVVAVAAVVRRCLPAPYAWLTGGRGAKGARRKAPAPERDAEATGLENEPTMAKAGLGSPSA